MGAGTRAVWLVTTELYPFSGGIGVYAHHTGAMLAQAGVTVSVLFHDPSVAVPDVRRVHGYRLIRFSSLTLHSEAIGQPELQGPLATAYQACDFIKGLIADEGPPDVIEFQDYGALGYFFLKHRLMEMDAQAPRVILTAHRPYVHCAATDDESLFEHRTAFLGDAERWCYAAADAVFAPCQFIVDALGRPDMAFPLHDVHVVRNPFDPTVIAEAADDSLAASQAMQLQRLQYGPDEPVLYFGKLQNQKGAWDLTAALAALYAQGEAAPLWMWGRDAAHSPSGTTTYDFLEQRYRRLFARELVRYFGEYSLGALRSLCASHPICVLPYRQECLPYAFIEVVLCGGIPVVSAAGGQAEILAPVHRAMLTVDFNQPQQLGQTLSALKALGPAERAKLSSALQTEIRTHTGYTSVAERKLAALDQVVLTSTRRDYPFVYGEARVVAPAPPPARARLANAILQRGATVSTIVTPGAQALRRSDLVSVIIPYFEMQEYLDETLAAIETQSHDAVEIIIVDDGSHGDAAKAKLSAVAARSSRFRITILRKYNGGLADARNAGARIAQGDYLYFLDADDLIHPATLSRGIEVLKRFDNVAYVGAWLREFGEGAREWLVWDVDGPYIGFHNLQICSFLIRAEAWLEHGGNDPAMSLGMEDYESHVRLFAAGLRGVALPRSYFRYRIRKASMSRAFNAHAQAFLQRRVIANNRGFYNQYGAQLAGMFAENGHGALAPPPTRETPAHAALFGFDLPSLLDVDHELEANASRERLGRALRARAYHGGPAWDYTVARLLLALDLAPQFAQRSLAAAVTREPDNVWYRLYAIVVHARLGATAAAGALWSPAFASFHARERDAVRWIAGLEQARGFPAAAHALFAPSTSAEAGPAVFDADPAFGEIHSALRVLKSTLPTGAPPHLRAATESLYAAAEPVVSSAAANALLNRWLLNWMGEGAVRQADIARLAAASEGPLGAKITAGLSDLGEWAEVIARRHATSPRVAAPQLSPPPPVSRFARVLSLR